MDEWCPHAELGVTPFPKQEHVQMPQVPETPCQTYNGDIGKTSSRTWDALDTEHLSGPHVVFRA